MRAKDSVKDYKGTLERYTNYAKKSIKYVCSTIGPRLSGSEAEHHAINYMANDLRDCCDEVAVESFKLHPRAFMAWVQLAVISGNKSVSYTVSKLSRNTAYRFRIRAYKTISGKTSHSGYTYVNVNTTG